MESEFKITQSEKNSILFYQGSVEKIKLEISQQYLNDFYSVPNAYEVMNALLFPGIKNEKVRIAQEERKFSAVLAENISELLHVYSDIYSAMCKYAFSSGKQNYHTCRKDRMHTLKYLKQGRTCSFFSTSMSDRIDESFHRKAGILLLEVEAPGCIEHLDMNAVLGSDSKYPDEEEILFAPFLYLDMYELELTEDEKKFRDINNEMPKEKYKVMLKGSLIDCGCEQTDGWDVSLIGKLKEEIQQPVYTENAVTVWKDLEEDREPDKKSLQLYIEWKDKIQQYLKLQFKRIKGSTLKNMSGSKDTYSSSMADDQRLRMLENEMNQYLVYTDTNRKKYDLQLTGLNMAVSILQPVGALAIAFSLMDGCKPFETAVKITSLVCNALCLILLGFVKSLALEGKIQQRTATYLKLDELQRDLRYETDVSTESVNRYIERFKHIVAEDDLKCEENVKGSITYTESLINKGDDKK